MIDAVCEPSDSLYSQILVSEECRDWCRYEKRTFLRHRVELRLSTLYLESKLFQKALGLLQELHYEVKKLDDKQLLVEILVAEARTHIALSNLPKAKVSLTAAKSNANAIYCPYLLQSEIDMISGIINAQEDDYKTAFSYFNEAFDSLHQNHEKVRASKALRYMLLSKIMAEEPKDVEQIVGSKLVALEYAGKETTEALLAIAKAQKTRSIESFENIVQKYQHDLSTDSVLVYHIRLLNERLVEQNLLRVVEPYSKVEIEHVARLIRLPADRVQKKLSDMILDSKLKGTLDQGIGVLILFDSDAGETMSGSLYRELLETMEGTSSCLDALFDKSKSIMASAV